MHGAFKLPPSYAPIVEPLNGRIIFFNPMGESDFQMRTVPLKWKKFIGQLLHQFPADAAVIDKEWNLEMGDKTTQEIIKCLDTAAKLLRGEAVSPNDNVGSSSHGSRTSENTTHSAELAIPITTVHVPSPSPSFQYSRVTSNLRNLFKPYGTSKGRGRGVNLPQPSASLSTWTHKFICLSSKDSEIIPSKDEKRTLFEAGLGERKLTLVKTSDSPDFLQQLEEKFPKLKGCGGIELLRTSSTSRSTLQLINPGQHGYTVEYLSNCYLGQATCFIRPIQKDLDATPIDEGEKTMQTEKCMTCGRDILLTQLRSHVREVCTQLYWLHY
ncbi:unnamed protein product [Mytilus edulis]|uniref:Uncharacterized protein n=1 Tax=Mytilus edulis TaxID=6550 RepID=A0A8S3R3B4_MYTED|nr:unnamed protein product [Mytilus edulis]